MMVTCAFGAPWPHVKPCAWCRGESERLRAELEAGVQAGRWDPWGYTPWDRHGTARQQDLLLDEARYDAP